MADFRLDRRPALGGLRKEICGTTLREIPELCILILSLAPLPDWAPAPGQSTALPGAGLILRLAADRLMALSSPEETRALPDTSAVTVDQSDFWTVLQLSGPLVLPALARCCRLDLHDTAFPTGACAKTPIEGISALLLRRSPDRFLTLCPRSYARDFAHVLDQSLHKTTP